jgi:hypothetical protein
VLRRIETDDAKKKELLNALRHGSLATYGHLNLHGEFDFSDERMFDPIGHVMI